MSQCDDLPDKHPWPPEKWHASRHRGEFESCWYCQRARAHCRSKIRFATREDVDEWVRDRNESSAYVQPVTRYPCRWCLGYHMTSASGKYQARRAERARRKWLSRTAVGGES